MQNEFERLANGLEGECLALSSQLRGLFLLAQAQRFKAVFEMFEQRAGRKREFAAAVDELWMIAKQARRADGVRSRLLSMIPGEDWVVDGLFDGLAQDVGGLAVGALEGLVGPEIEMIPESAVLEVPRRLLSVMRLGATEPADDARGHAFEANLHTEPLIGEELALSSELLRILSQAQVRVDDVHQFAVAHPFDLGRLEPDLSKGLALDS